MFASEIQMPGGRHSERLLDDGLEAGHDKGRAFGAHNVQLPGVLSGLRRVRHAQLGHVLGANLLLYLPSGQIGAVKHANTSVLVNGKTPCRFR